MPASLNQRITGIPAPILGLLLVVMASAFFASMHNTIRFMSQTEDIHPFEMAFFRVAFGLVVFIPFFMRSGIGILRTEKLTWHIGRAFINATSMLSWFMALSLMEVGDATAVSLIGPVFVAILAMVFLGEHVGPMRWLGIFLAVVGGLIVVRPGFTEISSGVWLVLFSAVAVSNSKLIAKILTRHDSPTTIVAYMTILMIPITFVPAFFVWQTPSLYQLFFMALIGVFGTIGHLLFVQAYKLADMSLVEPAMFTRMIWAALISLVLFAEFPSPWTWAGAGVIVVGTTLLARKETRRVPRRVDPNVSTVDPSPGD
ncbi:MAG: DMT family transporter [Rhodospirillaceae bacterium]|nr:DMT family transporter [Rhodospirillaceae bacterium]MBT6403974.1 DMT family transporter [Rhodospirillaceae bacterium]MBT6535381.1 DMT family transporter [Rhodospirillaceae bacterium]MBT7362391.1 DMT family transporter [Rhodospirillaceae bacterium]